MVRRLTKVVAVCIRVDEWRHIRLPGATSSQSPVRAQYEPNLLHWLTIIEYSIVVHSLLLRASRPLSVRRLLDTKVDNRSASRSGQKDEALTKLTHPRMQRYNDTSGKGRACDNNSYQRSCLSASWVGSPFCGLPTGK